MIFNDEFIMLQDKYCQILLTLNEGKIAFKNFPPFFCIRYTINQCDLIHHVYVYCFPRMITQKQQ